MEIAEHQAKEFVPGSAVHKVDKQQPWKRQDDTQGDTRSKARERCRHCNSVKHQPLTAGARVPRATSVSSVVTSSLLVRLRCHTRTKRVKPMCWRRGPGGLIPRVPYEFRFYVHVFHHHELRGDVKIHWQSLQTFAKVCWQLSIR